MTGRAAIPAALAAALVGCGGGPTLENLRCERGKDACQASSNPYQLDLLVDFTSEEGNLSGGVGRIVLDGEAQKPFALRPVFQRSDAGERDTSGTLRLTVNLELPGPRDGTAFDLGFEVEDTEGNLSNRPTITFRIDLAAGSRGAP